MEGADYYNGKSRLLQWKEQTTITTEEAGSTAFMGVWDLAAKSMYSLEFRLSDGAYQWARPGYLPSGYI